MHLTNWTMKLRRTSWTRRTKWTNNRMRWTNWTRWTRTARVTVVDEPLAKQDKRVPAMEEQLETKAKHVDQDDGGRIC